MYKEKKKRREVTTDNSVKLKRTKKKTLTWLNIVQISKRNCMSKTYCKS